MQQLQQAIYEFKTPQSLDDLLYYVHIQTSNFSTPVAGVNFFTFGNNQLMKIHKENVCLYLDKYIECSVPDVQSQLLMESMGINEDLYTAWLHDQGRFWVCNCDRPDIGRSEYLIPNVKGHGWNPYVRFLSSKVSGAQQVSRILDLVGVYSDVDLDNEVVFLDLVLTFPFEVAVLFLDPKKRDLVSGKCWDVWKLFNRECYRLFGLSLDQQLGNSVSFHPWSSEFPFFPHPHFHDIMSFWCFSHVSLEDRLGFESRDPLPCLYDGLYSFIVENEAVLSNGKKRVYRMISVEDDGGVVSLQAQIEKELAPLLGFCKIPWHDPVKRFPVDVAAIKCIWSECVDTVFDLNSEVDLDVVSESCYDVYVKWVSPNERAKLLHKFQYKSRPAVLDLDLFLRRCHGFIVGHKTVDWRSLFGYLSGLLSEARVVNDESLVIRYEVALEKLKYLYENVSVPDILGWLRYLIGYHTDTRVFGFWKSLKRYRVSSVVRGDLPKFAICPICGGVSMKVVAVNDIFVDCIILHKASWFYLWRVKPPPLSKEVLDIGYMSF